MDIYKPLEDILDKLNKLDKRLEVIENKLNGIQTSGDNMNRHIAFIENVYERIKYPFFYLFSTIGKLTSYKLSDKNKLIENNEQF